jgi:hypothetical protein
VAPTGVVAFGYTLSFLAGAAARPVGVGGWNRVLGAGPFRRGFPAHGAAETDRLRGGAQSLPGIEFQYRVEPGGEDRYAFVGERAEVLLGLSPEPSSARIRPRTDVPCAPARASSWC